MAVYVPPGFFDFIMSLNEEEAEQIMSARTIMNPSARSDRIPLPRGSKIAAKKVKKTRKVSRYQRVFGKHLKALKRKHPRTEISTLMKRAHRLTKRELK